MPKLKRINSGVLSEFYLGNPSRKELAGIIRDARRRDEDAADRALFDRTPPRWQHFGEEVPLFMRDSLVPKISAFIKKNPHSKIRILDCGAGSGKYWMKLIEEFPQFRGKFEILCLNPSRHGFIETDCMKLRVGTILTSTKNQLESLGKFDFVFSYLGEYFYSSRFKENFKRRAMDLLLERNEENLLLN